LNKFFIIKDIDSVMMKNKDFKMREWLCEAISKNTVEATIQLLECNGKALKTNQTIPVDI